MKAMFAAFAALVVICFGADMALEELDFSSKEATSGPAVRLGPE